MMKLLEYQPGFVNDPNIDSIILAKLNTTNYIYTENDGCLITEPSSIKKIYINLKIMNLDTKKLLDIYNYDTEELIISQSLILGLLDLKKFTRLKKLVCSSNEIMHIKNLPISLEYLDVSFNLLKFINLSHLSNLKYLQCSYNRLNQINLPNGLEYLDCRNNNLFSELEGLNKLTNLHTLICSFNRLDKIIFPKSNSIKKLEIVKNKFRTLENIPNSVEYLNCSYNMGINLDFERLEHLKILNCSNCLISKLNNLPPNLKELVCSNNELVNLDNLPCGIKILFCRENCLTTLDYLPDSLEVLFVGNNKNLSNLNNLNCQLKELECEHCYQITNFMNLPNNLNYLSYIFKEKYLCNLNILPNSIKELNAIIIGSKNYCLDKIPNSLKELNILYEIYDTNKIYKYANGKFYEDIINKLSNNLPLELKKINFKNNNIILNNKFLNYCSCNNIQIYICGYHLRV